MDEIGVLHVDPSISRWPAQLKILFPSKLFTPEPPEAGPSKIYLEAMTIFTVSDIPYQGAFLTLHWVWFFGKICG